MAAQLMAKRTEAALDDFGFSIERIFVSPAVRARKTFKAFTRCLPDWKKRQVCEVALYGSDYDVLLEVLSELPESLNSVAIIGHNPELAELFEYLTGQDPEKFPTATVALLELNQSWQSLNEGDARCIWFDYPKRKLKKS